MKISCETLYIIAQGQIPEGRKARLTLCMYLLRAVIHMHATRSAKWSIATFFIEDSRQQIFEFHPIVPSNPATSY